jgi:hypothetical protein
MDTEESKGLSFGGWVATYALAYFALVVATAVFVREDVVDYLIRERITLMSITFGAISLAITTVVDQVLARSEGEDE